MKFIQILFISFTLVNISFSQNLSKKMMDESVYAKWNTVQSPKISNNGEWVVYQLKPGEGDMKLKFFNSVSKKEYTFERGENAKITDDSKYIIFKITASADSVKMMKRNKVRKKDMPKDTLGIYNLATHSLIKIPNVKSFKVPEKWNGHIAYLKEKQVFTKGDTISIKPKKKETYDNGTRLTIRTLESGEEQMFTFVKNYTLSEEGGKMLFSSTGNDSTFSEGIYCYDFFQKELKTLYKEKGEYKFLTFDEKGNQAAFLSNVDSTDLRVAPFQLYYWNGKSDTANMVFNNTNTLLNENWIVSKNRRLFFSGNGNRLFFGVAPPPILQDTSLLQEEIVQVEVWSYTDKKLYTRQESDLKRDKNKSYLTVYDIPSHSFYQLANLKVDDIGLGDEGNANMIVGFNSKPYLERTSWEGWPSYKDLYVKNLEGGGWEQIAKEVRGNPQMSPKGNYIYWHSPRDTAWFTYSFLNKKTTQISNNKISKFYDELNDRPMHPRNTGMAGWTTDDKYLLLYDRYDIWKIHPQYEEPPTRLTKGREAVDPTVFRYIRLDREERNIDLKQEALLHSFKEKSKQEGYLSFNFFNKRIQRLVEGDYAFSNSPQKAKDVNFLLFTKESFQLFPDLILVKNNNFNQEIKISAANPQQNEYSWGAIEPYTWTSLDGEELTGLLVKPANFDPNKKYPMLVNFYERSSHTLHRHRAPYPHRSTINYSYYSNRGYVIFNPDVPYRIGYPGESAYNAVIPGVTSLIEKGFVDADNIGMQGHSWGGYQAAYIVTKSNIFKCAESGAPVVNMISAYGGIRWGSGMSRAFQYEHTQSRIGGTPWEYPVRYIENSPIFFIDKIETPLLILHNDKDGAVPWYQGIEFFNGLRRLGKPAWMLNYNDEPHWPVKLQNRKDFNLRMQQFFDFYLQGKPKPMWMERGVPAMEKGIRQGLEFKKD
jgi:dipeptidyl aminopeptidase/acylaminoacyl peptidase